MFNLQRCGFAGRKIVLKPEGIMVGTREHVEVFILARRTEG